MTTPFNAANLVATTIPEQACPGCGAPLRRGRASVPMKSGDVAVCADCATLLVVGEGYRIERMTVERLATLPEPVRDTLLALARSIARLRPRQA